MKLSKLIIFTTISIAFTSCSFLSDLIMEPEETITNNSEKEKVENSGKGKKEEGTKEKEKVEETNEKEEELINYEDTRTELIELDYRGLTDNSAFSNEYVLSFGKDTNKYDISYEYYNESDHEFFNITKKDNSLVIKALNENRHTYLNIIYKEKGKTEEAKRDKITLLSNSTNYDISSFNPTKLGETNIEDNKYVSIKLKQVDLFASSNKTNDLVLPSKVKFEDNIKEVGSVTSVYNKMFYCRDIFIPSTIFNIGENAFPFTQCFGYLDIRKSNLGFLFCEPSSIVYSLTSYFLLEQADKTNYQSRFFAGPDYYSFPYTKATYKSEKSWDSAEYNSWDWQTNYVGVYKNNSSTYNALRKTFAENNYYFCN